ncbi:fibronectin type III domain-containing protein [Mumia zhuanghuii]|uniref:fibronectin type III domain-containing protein n=1 Tax=Mumia zhuanghuii TaxID=2585211 RepID=UPI003633573E
MNRTRLVGAVAGAALAGGVLAAAPAEAAAAAEPVDVRPERTIIGTRGGVNPWDILLTASGRVYASDYHRHRVVVYGARARGNAKPLYRLQGPRTRIVNPGGLSRDAKGRLHVFSDRRILVFAKNARGNVRPVRQMRPRPNPIPDKARGAYATERNVDGRLWVGWGEEGFIEVFAPGAGKDAKPERKITVDRPGLWEPEMLRFDRAGRVYVGTHTGEVDVLSPNANGVTKPLFTLSNARQSHIDGMSMIRSGKLAVSDGRKIVVYPRLLAPTRPWKVRRVTVARSAGAAKRVVRWRKPVADGGASITRYKVTVMRGDRVVKVAVVKGSRRSYVLARRDLPAGENTVRVRAKNRKGYGPVAQATFTVRK